MTSGGKNFNDFPANQTYQMSCSLNSVRLKQIGTTHSFVHSKLFHCCEYKQFKHWWYQCSNCLFIYLQM